MEIENHYKIFENHWFKRIIYLVYLISDNGKIKQISKFIDNFDYFNNIKWL